MSKTINKIDFRDATRQQAKACIAIDGLSGTGKSGLALMLAYTLAGGDWSKTYACDTENKSLDLFQGINTHTGEKFDKFRKFDLLSFYGYSPSNYYAIKEAAKKNGALALVIDSATHMWQGAGGMLSIVSDAKAKEGSKTDNYRVWGLDYVKAERDLIVECIRDADIHVITTIRVKEKFEYDTGADGKKALLSLGEQQIMMPDLKYEPDLVLSMVSPGSTTGKAPVALVTKSRYAILEKDQKYEFTPELMGQIKAYLNDGADPELLKEAQRQELILMVTDILTMNKSKETMFPYLKEALGVKETPLVELTLPLLRTIYTQLVL